MKYDAQVLEPEIIEYWDNNKIYKKIKEKNKGKKKYYFLDGPPYTSGKIHIGQAWNKSMKDMIIRYKRMKGLDVWDRAGYDMHGLPTAHKVEAKFGIESKDEIPKFGVDKFIRECEKLATENMDQMNLDFKRLGVWMDFENAYKPITKKFIEGEWWLIKKAHENNRLYEGKRTIHWCSHCATALAKHELEYKEIKDTSIFVKLKIADKENEYLIIWTTTPWTIPFNLAVMVNPELEYIKAKVDDEIWVIAKGLAAPVVQSVVNKKLEIIDEFKGDKLEGIKYIHPFSDTIKDYKEMAAKHPKLHTVVLSSEYVDLSAGTGLVHCAPGCGPEDYEVGYRNGLPTYNNIDEFGIFPEHMGDFAGKYAKKDDDDFIEALRDRKALIETTDVEHDYAHCWRCKQPVVFRTTKQWFFKIEDLKEEMRELNKQVKWQPDWAGNRQFDSWLNNLRDNSITRQRYWGCPVPIWRCTECGKYDVIGTVKELVEKGGKEPENLHRPWIDKVEIPCECGATKIRVPDILDVWIDAGTNSWTCLDYPEREDYFKELFPADFILEGKDQIRGWFNLLFVASMVSMKKPSYKAVYMHGFVQDAEGRKMSKSLGNIISPYEVIDRFGSDTLRYYMISGSKAGVDINYNFDDMKVKNKNLSVLWNIHNFLLNYSNELGENTTEIDMSLFENHGSIEEKYMFSKLYSAMQKATNLFEEYRLDEIPDVIEELFLDLSRTYMQMVREKSVMGSKEEKKTILFTIYKVFLETLKMFSTIAPFITEKMYLNIKDKFKLKEESIHHFEWPKSYGNIVRKDLEENMGVAKMIIQSSLAAREKAQLGLRWPLKEITVVTEKDYVNKATREMYEIIKNQVNTKEVHLAKKIEGIKKLVKPDFAKLGPDFGDKAPKIIAALSTTSAETILDSIKKKEKFVVEIDGKKYNIVKEHIIVQEQCPVNLEGMEFRGGVVYINTDRTPELDAEGFAREITRRVQSNRKIAELQKTDRIELGIVVPEELKTDITKLSKVIAEKCGADKIEIATEMTKEYKIKAEEKIKGKMFGIRFTKV